MHVVDNVGDPGEWNRILKLANEGTKNTLHRWKVISIPDFGASCTILRFDSPDLRVPVLPFKMQQVIRPGEYTQILKLANEWVENML